MDLDKRRGAHPGNIGGSSSSCTLIAYGLHLERTSSSKTAEALVNFPDSEEPEHSVSEALDETSAVSFANATISE
jgi:hypothetical protein